MNFEWVGIVEEFLHKVCSQTNTSLTRVTLEAVARMQVLQAKHPSQVINFHDFASELQLKI